MLNVAGNVKAALLAAHLPANFWPQVLQQCSYAARRRPDPVTKRCAIEMLTGKPADVSKQRKPGVLVYTVDHSRPNKMSPKALAGVHLGTDSGGVRLLALRSNKILTARFGDCVFYEDIIVFDGQGWKAQATRLQQSLAKEGMADESSLDPFVIFDPEQGPLKLSRLVPIRAPLVPREDVEDKDAHEREELKVESDEGTERRVSHRTKRAAKDPNGMFRAAAYIAEEAGHGTGSKGRAAQEDVRVVNEKPALGDEFEASKFWQDQLGSSALRFDQDVPIAVQMCFSTEELTNAAKDPHFVKADSFELEGLKEMGAIVAVPKEAVPLEDRKTAVGCFWLRKVKYVTPGDVPHDQRGLLGQPGGGGSSELVPLYKSRLTVNGRAEKDVQLEDTLSPAAGVHLVYLFMSRGAKFGLTKHLQNDLTKAFPQTQLEPGRTIYLIPPPGSEDAKLGLLWRADKNMYGRKPGPRCLNVDMSLTLTNLGYVATRMSPSILFKKTVHAFILCLVHLDDTRWAGREEDSESMECDLGAWEKKYKSNRVSIS